jgi:hypothetical protein
VIIGNAVFDPGKHTPSAPLPLLAHRVVLGGATSRPLLGVKRPQPEHRRPM